MQYKEYGKTGLQVSALGFGAMRLPFENQDESVRLLQRGMDLGINYIDSAYGYGAGDGESEKLVGEAIQGRREQVYIATKNPSVWEDHTPETWWKRLEISLERFRTSYIDFYKVVHALDWNTFTTVYESKLHKEALKAKEQGMIRHLCFSCHDTPEGMKKLIDTGLFEGLLIQYNLLDRTNEEVIAYAHERNVAVEVMGPVGGGRLGLASAKMREMVPGTKSTPELALRFVMANPGVTIAFSGMNEMQQVEENCAVASKQGPLTEDEMQAVEQALEENRRLSELYCTGCGYCQPCPHEVAIPDVFIAMNYHRVWGLTDYAKELYRNLGHKTAAACVACSQCEEKCPQKLAIVEQLKESHEALS